MFNFGELAVLLNEVVEQENSEFLRQVAAIEPEPPTSAVDDEEEEVHYLTAETESGKVKAGFFKLLF